MSKSLLKITADFPDFYDQKYLCVDDHQVILNIEQTTYFNSGIPCFLAEIRYGSDNGANYFRLSTRLIDNNRQISL